MKIEVDTDFLLPLLVAFCAIILTIASQTLVPASSIDELRDENIVLFQELSDANHELSDVTKELDTYHISQKTLTDLGASDLEARRAMMAAEVNGVDPKHLGL